MAYNNQYTSPPINGQQQQNRPTYWHNNHASKWQHNGRYRFNNQQNDNPFMKVDSSNVFKEINRVNNNSKYNNSKNNNINYNNNNKFNNNSAPKVSKIEIQNNPYLTVDLSATLDEIAKEKTKYASDFARQKIKQNNNKSHAHSSTISVKHDNPYHPSNYYKDKTKNGEMPNHLVNIIDKAKANKKTTKKDQNNYNSNNNTKYKNNCNKNDDFNDYCDYYDDYDADFDEYDNNSGYHDHADHKDNILSDHSNINKMGGSEFINESNINTLLSSNDTVLVLDQSNNIDYLILRFIKVHNDNSVEFIDFSNKPVIFFMDQLPPIFKPIKSSNTNTSITIAMNNKNNDIDDDNKDNIQNNGKYFQGQKILVEENGESLVMTIQNYNSKTTKTTANDAIGSIHVFYLKNTNHTIV